VSVGIKICFASNTHPGAMGRPSVQMPKSSRA
jgi:hypothetical protein